MEGPHSSNYATYTNDRRPTLHEAHFPADVTPDEVEFSRIQVQEPRSADATHENTLHRALNANQITMIILGGTLGTGLLVGSGSGLHEGGPLGLTLAYVIVSSICYCMMNSLCEMATYLPHKKGFVGLVSRYVHPAVGFALGWTYLCRFLIVPAAHINTAAIVIAYGAGGIDRIPVDALRIIFIILVVGVNFFGIRLFGHFEFWLSTFKVFALIALILFGIIVDLGGVRLRQENQDALAGLAGLYWRPDHGPFGHPKWKYVGAQGDTLLFLGFWSTLVRSLFSLMGMELLGVVVGEAANPRVSVPKAVKRTFRLVITLYVMAVIVMGFICSSKDEALENPQSRLSEVSPFVIAAKRLVSNGLAPVVNSAIAVFALSGATSNVYTGSRLLYGLALDHQAPALLRKVSAGGRPLASLAAVTIFCFLSFIGHDEQVNVFDYFIDVTTTAGSISWICIFWAHIRFRESLHAQNYRLDTLRYTAPLHPIGTKIALIGTIIITLFKGVGPFASRGYRGFIAAYILIVFFFLLLLVWWFLNNDPATLRPVNQIDLDEGKAEIDEEEDSWRQYYSTRPPRPWWKRISEYT